MWKDQNISSEILNELEEANRSSFNRWASRYDQEVLSDYKYVAPKIATKYLSKHQLNKKGR